MRANARMAGAHVPFGIWDGEDFLGTTASDQLGGVIGYLLGDSVREPPRGVPVAVEDIRE